MYNFFQIVQRYENSMAMALNRFGKILLFVALSAGVVNGYNCKNEPKCKLIRTYGMKTADCFRREFTEIPKCLSTDIEVLELTYNRIRKITRAEISRYSNLRILYLGENFLSSLTEDTFVDLDNIIALDLSMNGIVTLPEHIFRMPSLEKLYLRHNLNMNLEDSLEKAKPIDSPLVLLDISFTTEEGNGPVFPDFGPMTSLYSLNVTGNKYSLMLPRHFAGLCKMERLITDNVTAQFYDPCDCWRINGWLKQRHVEFKPFTCPILKTDCTNFTISALDMEIYKDCNALYERRLNYVKMKRGFIILLSILAVFFFLVVSYFIVYYNVCAKRSEELEYQHLAARLALIRRSRRNVDNVYVL